MGYSKILKAPNYMGYISRDETNHHRKMNQKDEDLGAGDHINATSAPLRQSMRVKHRNALSRIPMNARRSYRLNPELEPPKIFNIERNRRRKPDSRRNRNKDNSQLEHFLEEFDNIHLNSSPPDYDDNVLNSPDSDLTTMDAWDEYAHNFFNDHDKFAHNLQWTDAHLLLTGAAKRTLDETREGNAITENSRNVKPRVQLFSHEPLTLKKLSHVDVPKMGENVLATDNFCRFSAKDLKMFDAVGSFYKYYPAMIMNLYYLNQDLGTRNVDNMKDSWNKFNTSIIKVINKPTSVNAKNDLKNFISTSLLRLLSNGIFYVEQVSRSIRGVFDLWNRWKPFYDFLSDDYKVRKFKSTGDDAPDDDIVDIYSFSSLTDEFYDRISNNPQVIELSEVDKKIRMVADKTSINARNVISYATTKGRFLEIQDAIVAFQKKLHAIHKSLSEVVDRVKTNMSKLKTTIPNLNVFEKDTRYEIFITDVFPVFLQKLNQEITSVSNWGESLEWFDYKVIDDEFCSGIESVHDKLKEPRSKMLLLRDIPFALSNDSTIQLEDGASTLDQMKATSTLLRMIIYESVDSRMSENIRNMSYSLFSLISAFPRYIERKLNEGEEEEEEEGKNHAVKITAISEEDAEIINRASDLFEEAYEASDEAHTLTMLADIFRPKVVKKKKSGIRLEKDFLNDSLNKLNDIFQNICENAIDTWCGDYRITNCTSLRHLQMILVSFYHVPHYMSDEIPTDASTLKTCHEMINVWLPILSCLNKFGIELLNVRKSSVSVKTTYDTVLKPLLKFVENLIDVIWFIVDWTNTLYRKSNEYITDLYGFIKNQDHYEAVKACEKLIQFDYNSRNGDDKNNPETYRHYFEDVDLLMFRLVYHNKEFENLFTSVYASLGNMKAIFVSGIENFSDPSARHNLDTDIKMLNGDYKEMDKCLCLVDSYMNLMDIYQFDIDDDIQIGSSEIPNLKDIETKFGKHMKRLNAHLKSFTELKKNKDKIPETVSVVLKKQQNDIGIVEAVKEMCEEFSTCYKRIILLTKWELAKSKSSWMNSGQFSSLVDNMNLCTEEQYREIVKFQLDKGVYCLAGELTDEDHQKNNVQLFDLCELKNQWDYMRAAIVLAKEKCYFNEIESSNSQKEKLKLLSLEDDENDDDDDEDAVVLLTFKPTVESGGYFDTSNWESILEAYSKIISVSNWFRKVKNSPNEENKEKLTEITEQFETLFSNKYIVEDERMDDDDEEDNNELLERVAEDKDGDIEMAKGNEDQFSEEKNINKTPIVMDFNKIDESNNQDTMEEI